MIYHFIRDFLGIFEAARVQPERQRAFTDLQNEQLGFPVAIALDHFGGDFPAVFHVDTSVCFHWCLKEASLSYQPYCNREN